jgi:hypothetical protein
MNFSIAVIVPFYGAWPKYFKAFLTTCANNPVLRYKIITDLKPPIDVPENVEFISMSLNALCERVSQRIGIKIEIPFHRKICDFRPSWGHVFEDVLVGYSHWAYGDIDLLLGRTAQFISGEDLERYDVISGHSLWLSGCLTILKNTPFCRFMYQEEEYYRKAFTNPKFLGFDECHCFWKEVLEHKTLDCIPSAYLSFSQIVTRNSEKGIIKTRFTDIYHEHLTFGKPVKYQDGVVTNSLKEEKMLVHYVTSKKSRFFYISEKNYNRTFALITTTGFYYSPYILLRFIIFLWRVTKTSLRMISNYRLWSKLFTKVFLKLGLHREVKTSLITR